MMGMSITSNIDYLYRLDGVQAVIVKQQDGTVAVRSPDDESAAIIDEVVKMHALTKVEFSVIVGSNTIRVFERGFELAGVCHPTGHPIAKSLIRSVDRAAGQDCPSHGGSKPGREMRKPERPKPKAVVSVATKPPSMDFYEPLVSYPDRPLPTVPTRPW